MRNMTRILGVAATLALCVAGSYLALAQTAQPSSDMNFFVTSRGPGNGADLGGLAGADTHCQMLAAAVGAGARTWRAYLSTDPLAGQPAVNARDRIGPGPFINAQGVMVALTVDELHSPQNNVNKQTAITEQGAIVNGRGDNPNTHDMLTGSTVDGRSFNDGADHTCSNYTNGRSAGVVQLGHHDKSGPQAEQTFNSVHPSRGCSQPDLVATGGAGLFYCFAVPAS
jgi:hypothetical protein